MYSNTRTLLSEFVINYQDDLLDNNSMINLLSVNRNSILSRKYKKTLICKGVDKDISTFLHMFKGLIRLTIVFSRNKDVFKNIQFSKRLRYLDLKYNNLETKDLQHMLFPDNIRVLNISSNNITDMNFKLPRRIKWLDVSNNSIKSLKDVKLPKHLRMASFSENLLTNISFDGLKIKKRLRLLDISNNKISDQNLIDISNKYNVIVKSYLLVSRKTHYTYISPGSTIDSINRINDEYINNYIRFDNIRR